MSYNKISLIGNLGRDPELRYTPQGDAVCDFSLATSEKRNEQEKTTWFKVSIWGRRAETMGQYLAKGSQVYVEGRLRLDEYTDHEGSKRVTLNVTATEIQFLSRKSENPENQLTRKAQATTPSDEDIPF